MKKIAWRRVFFVLGIIFMTVCLLYAFVFNNTKQKGLVCKAIDVEIKNSEGLGFVKPDDVRSVLQGVIGKPLNDSVVVKAQKLLETKSYIKNTLVYISSDSVLHVETQQRRPLVRIITSSGSCYLDKDGFAFPASALYASHVTPVTGDVPLPYKLPYKGPLPKNDTVFVSKLLKFAEFLDNNDFWNAQIQQINVDKSGNAELTLSTCNSIVLFGQLDEYEKKLSNLLVFYNTILAYEGWGKYEKLDLRFENQVVATPHEREILN